MTALRNDHYRNLDEVLALLESLTEDIEKYLERFRVYGRLDEFDKNQLYNLKSAQNKLKKADAAGISERLYEDWKNSLSVHLNGNCHDKCIDPTRTRLDAFNESQQLELDLKQKKNSGN